MARDRRPIVIRPSQRRQRSRQQRERGKQRAILIAGAIAILFIIAIPAYGYWANFIAPPRAVVLQVDDNKYTLGYMLKYLTGLHNIGIEPSLSEEPFRLLQALEENALVRSGAADEGVYVESEDVDQEIRERMIGRSPELAETPEDQLDREFSEVYRQYLSTIRLSKSEHREIVEADLLREGLKESFSEDIPESTRQADMAWIVLPPDDPLQMDEVSQRLEEGEEFADLADEYSTDRSSAVVGGVLGWVPEGAYPVLDDTIFALQPDEVSDPIRLESGYFILKVFEVEEDRPVEDAMRNRMEEIAYQQWITEERSDHYIKVCFGGGSTGGSCDWQYDWLVKRLVEEIR